MEQKRLIIVTLVLLLVSSLWAQKQVLFYTAGSVYEQELMEEDLSSDASLRDLSISSGELVPSFDPDINNYYVDTTSLPSIVTVSATANHSQATIEGAGDFDKIPGIDTIQVRAEDSSRMLYTIQFAHDSIIPRLDTLTLSSGRLIPSFHPDTTEYLIDLPINSSGITVDASIADSTSTIEGAGEFDKIPGIDTIKVLSEDGFWTTYTLEFLHDTVNPRLSDLSVLSGEGDTMKYVPLFNSEITDYFIDTLIDKVEVIATTDDTTAIIEGDGEFTDIPGFDTIKVTSAAGFETFYTIQIGNIITKPKLDTLFVSDGKLSPDFDPDTYSYYVNLPSGTTSDTVQASVDDTTNTIQGVGAFNTIPGIDTIRVISEKGRERIYTIEFDNSGLSSNTRLEELSVAGGTLDPSFISSKTRYQVKVPHGTDSAIVSASPSNSNAIVVGTGTIKEIPGKSMIIVIAEDDTRRIYTLEFMYMQREGVLRDLKADDGVLSPDFNPDTLHYTLNLYEEYSSVEISAVSEDDRYTIEGDGEFSDIPGTVVISVLDTNKEVVNEYTIEVTEKTGVTEVENDRVIIYPNPASKYLYLRYHAKPQRIELYNPAGVQVLSDEEVSGSSSLQLNIADLTAGIYFLRIYTQKGVIIKKIIKK